MGSSLAAGPLIAAVSVWWRALRPFSFSASITPVLVGSAAAFFQGTFDPIVFVVTLAASVSIHAATNLANDYYDHVRGVDETQPIGPGGAIQHGILSARKVLAGALLLFALGGTLGLWLVALRGWPVLVIGALSVLAGYAYTGGPMPLGYVGLGDLTVMIFMGFGIVCGSYYVQTGSFSPTAIWAAVPMAALVDAILVANNLRDLNNDRAKGKRTLAVLIGPSRTKMHFALLLVLAYGSVVLGTALGALPIPALLIFITVPDAMRAWKVVAAESDPSGLTSGAVRRTANLHLRLGLALAFGFVGDALIRLP